MQQDLADSHKIWLNQEPVSLENFLVTLQLKKEAG